MSKSDQTDDRENQEAEFQAIRSLTEQKRYQEAYERLHELLRRRGTITGMQAYLSSLAYFLGKKEEAIDLMRLAIGALPRSRKASLQFICLLAGCGRDSEIQLEIERFLSQIDAQDSIDHKELANIIRQLPDKTQERNVSIAVQNALICENDWFVKKQ